MFVVRRVEPSSSWCDMLELAVGELIDGVGDWGAESSLIWGAGDLSIMYCKYQPATQVQYITIEVWHRKKSK